MRFRLAAMLGGVCLLAGLAQVVPAQPSADAGVTAIDVLLDPDAVMTARAGAANARLRADFPKGFALDADHAPHVTIVQRYVRTADLEKVYAAVAKVTRDENPTGLELKATGYYDIPYQGLGLAGIVIRPTPELLRLQQKVLDALAPYTVEKGTGAAFAPDPTGAAINQPTIDYVAGFVPAGTGAKYNPHVTVGIGTRAFCDKLKAEPFEAFAFKPRAVSVYQLGNFGTAQKLLWTSAPADPLPSWKDAASKRALLAFVAKTTTPGGAEFVPPAERIAVFDNDGTLWCEQPVYTQLAFALDQVKALAPRHPEWANKEPFKAVLAGDLKAVAAGGEKALVELLMATHAGMTTTEFEATVRAWITTAKHPRLDRPYTELVYQPMLEVLAHLRANGYKTYIVSGGGVEFMRVWAERVYGIPPEQVIGSTIVTEYQERDGVPTLVRLPRLDFNDDKAGKPVAINKFIGRRQVMCFGNSDGDYEMLRYTTAGPGPRFGLIVHHTDAEREYAYDRTSHVGRLARALDEAPARGWTVASMKDDWATVFPPRK
ncbi:MAG: HAD family hydrolase [Gemmataceae bacterium]